MRLDIKKLWRKLLRKPDLDEAESEITRTNFSVSNTEDDSTSNDADVTRIAAQNLESTQISRPVSVTDKVGLGKLSGKLGVFEKNKNETPLREASSINLNSESPNASAIRNQKQNQNRPKIEKYYPHMQALLVGILLADLCSDYVRQYMLPSSAKPVKQQGIEMAPRQMLRADYKAITDRNIFNSDGVIPPALAKEKEGDNSDLDGPAIPSQLPISLLGTIVHINPAKSVASLQVRGSESKTIPYIPNDDIEGMATLLKVERSKAFFRNTRSGRIEYIELKLDSNLKFGFLKTQAALENSEVARTGNDFKLKRGDVEKYLSNLQDVLQQARAVPYRSPDTGEIVGFKFLDVQADSIIAKLGLEPGDILTGVNGEVINSPKKAMDMYMALRSANNIEIKVNKNGKDEVLNYSITE